MESRNNFHIRDGKLELVLDFCAELSRRMVLAGANLERVNISIERVCHAYGLREVCCLLLSTRVELSARDEEGRYASRAAAIPPAGIDLRTLKSLNRLSYTICEKKYEPSQLMWYLEEAGRTIPYPDWAVMLARVAAMGCLCLIFGGTWRELIPVAIVTALMHYVMLLMALPSLDKIVSNAITMLIATAAVLLLVETGISDNIPVIIITISMVVIPGIPLVNAVRNLLCGFEMNGTLQLLKVTIETLALAMGIFVAMSFFGPDLAAYDVTVTAMSDPLGLILLSFAASVSFGVVFHIAPKDLPLAGLGSALTRVALILFSTVFPTRLVYVTLAALVASLYAEFLAGARKDPSTYFVYPSIVPLIPGDLFYYALIGVYMGERTMFETNAANCLLTLTGMSIGFVLSSIIAHYIRKWHLGQLIKGKK
ncbi:MAG: threonine/serine ThrE exporter family protein [bacterium]